MMKTILLTIFISLSAVLMYAQDANDVSTLINAGKVDEAISKYEALPAHESADIYYNLGQLYHQKNNIAKAALNYERALKIKANHQQASNNLSLIREETDLDIIPVEEMFLIRWWKNIAGMLSANVWAMLSILAAAFLIFMLYCWWMPQGYMSKKRAFIGTVATPLVLLLCLALGRTAQQLQYNQDYAIVMQNDYDMHEGADDRSPISKDIMEGTKVNVLDQIGEWLKVTTADTDTGWLKASEVERI